MMMAGAARRTTTQRRSRRHGIAWLAVAGAFCAGSASSQVFEVGAGGALQTPGNGAAEAPPSNPEAGLVEAAPIVPVAAITPASQPTVPANFRALVTDVAEKAGVSPDLLGALVWQESRWRSDARSPAGAVGLAQLMPSTARGLGVDPHDPAANLAGAATYLRQLLDRFHGNVEEALAAYNAGPNRVARFNAVPPIAETQAYVAAIARKLSSTVLAVTP